MCIPLGYIVELYYIDGAKNKNDYYCYIIIIIIIISEQLVT
jgi:hypothetical protein